MGWNYSVPALQSWHKGTMLLLWETVGTHTHAHNHFAAVRILSRTTWVSRYQKKHSPTHTYRGYQSSLICFIHLLRSMASSLFNPRAWQSHSKPFTWNSILWLNATHPNIRPFSSLPAEVQPHFPFLQARSRERLLANGENMKLGLWLQSVLCFLHCFDTFGWVVCAVLFCLANMH